MSADLAALKAYVTAPGVAGGANRDESTVLLHVTHSNLKQRFLELRFNLHSTIDNIKAKIYQHCGTSGSDMVLQLKDENGTVVALLDDDSRPLGYYSPEDGYTMHVVDTNTMSMSANGWLEDVSLVEKYEISDADYNARENTYRKFKEKKLADDPNWSLNREMAEKRGEVYVEPKREDDPDAFAAPASALAVGSRCEVQPGGKRGEIMFVGRDCEPLPLGWWCGVKFDEPVGKHDGSVKGKRFFECDSGFGSMLRPDKVTAGDFPEIDPFASDEDEL